VVFLVVYPQDDSNVSHFEFARAQLSSATASFLGSLSSSLPVLVPSLSQGPVPEQRYSMSMMVEMIS
jgi:hypothetical protein